MLQSVPFPLCACYFFCVTLHFVLPSYLECSVKWVEFICLCSIHCFRYYMIFLLKSIWNSFQTLCIDGLFSHLFHFTQIEFDDCNDVIILPLIVLVYVSLWSFTCIWLHAQWICEWFSQMNECLNIVYHLILWDLCWEIPLWERNINIFLKWFCCYLRVCLLQPGYILSCNKLAPLPGTKVHICPGRTTKI